MKKRMLHLGPREPKQDYGVFAALVILAFVFSLGTETVLPLVLLMLGMLLYAWGIFTR